MFEVLGTDNEAIQHKLNAALVLCWWLLQPACLFGVQFLLSLFSPAYWSLKHLFCLLYFLQTTYQFILILLNFVLCLTLLACLLPYCSVSAKSHMAFSCHQTYGLAIERTFNFCLCLFSPFNFFWHPLLKLTISFLLIGIMVPSVLLAWKQNCKLCDRFASPIPFCSVSQLLLSATFPALFFERMHTTSCHE